MQPLVTNIVVFSMFSRLNIVRLARLLLVPFFILLLATPATANDTFASAESLTPAGGSLTGTTTGTTGQTGEPLTFGAGSLNTQWYNWTAPTTGTAFFATCNTTGNTTTNFDTTLGVYTGAAVNALTAVATNDDQGVGCEETANLGSGWAAGLSFAATAGTTYRIQIDGYGSTVGNFTLNWGYAGITTAVTTGSATEGGATGAFTVVLAAPPTGTVTVTVPTAATFCTLAPASLTFTMATWNVPQTVTVTAVNDTVVNGTRTCGAANLTAAGGGYAETKAIPAITVIDNDASVTLTKISLGAVGGFSFTGTNGIPNQTLTTATSGTAVSGTAGLLTTAGSTTTITETAVAGYATTDITCTGLGSGGTAAPNLAAGSVTLDASATIGGSAINCTFTNTKKPTLTLTKTSNGGVGGFAFTGNNGFANQTITTATAGTAVTGATQTLTAASIATTITEAIPANYFISSISCTGLGSGGTASPTLSSGTVVLNAAAVAPGANITCTYVNTKAAPSLVVAKSVSPAGPFLAGQTVTYTYKVTNNGNVPMQNVAINDTHNGTGAFSGAKNESLTTDAAPLGDSSDAAANDGIWSVIGPGDSVTFIATYVVTQHDIDFLQ